MSESQKQLFRRRQTPQPDQITWRLVPRDLIFYSEYPGRTRTPQCLMIYSEYPERTRTSRGREPSEALTIPCFSIISIMRAARL